MEKTIEWILDNIVTIIGYCISIGLFGYIFRDRKKEKSERKNTEASAMDSMQRVYDAFTIDMKERVDEFRLEIENLKGQVKILKEELETEQIKYRKLKQDYLLLEETHEELKTSINNL